MNDKHFNHLRSYYGHGDEELFFDRDFLCNYFIAKEMLTKKFDLYDIDKNGDIIKHIPSCYELGIAQCREYRRIENVILSNKIQDAIKTVQEFEKEYTKKKHEYYIKEEEKQYKLKKQQRRWYNPWTW